MFGERVARWAEEEEEAGMDVGIACLLPLESSGGSASSAGCETRRARVCALAHAAAVLTVRVVQIDESRPAWRRATSERGSAGVKGRGRINHAHFACLLRLLRAPTPAHTRTHARCVQSVHTTLALLHPSIHHRSPPGPCG